MEKLLEGQKSKASTKPFLKVSLLYCCLEVSRVLANKSAA
uniref:Uncharacterized protein n=1 Tax=Anguilla anguilla TaxID=7936 RepID=A0A0E9VVA0_ANGAN